MIKQKLGWLVAVILLLNGSIIAAQPVQIFTDEDGGYLGVQIRDVTANDVKDLKLSREAGVVVESVESDSPAEKAGLEQNDVITEYSGTPVLGARQFRRMVLETPPDRQVDLKLVRNGQVQTKNVQVGERKTPGVLGRGGDREFRFRIPEGPDGDEFSFRMPEFRGREPGRRMPIESSRPRLGINGVELTEQMAQFLGVPGGDGVLVMEVRKDTPAEKSGLRAGDVIIAVDGKTVASVADLSRSLDDGDRNLDIVRDKKKQTVRVRIETKQSGSSGEAKRL